MQKIIQVVIKLPEQDYELACTYPEVLFGSYAKAIKNGTVLPEQHGDLIDRNELLKNDVGKIMGFRESDIINAPTILEGTVKK